MNHTKIQIITIMKLASKMTTWENLYVYYYITYPPLTWYSLSTQVVQNQPTCQRISWSNTLCKVLIPTQYTQCGCQARFLVDTGLAKYWRHGCIWYIWRLFHCAYQYLEEAMIVSCLWNSLALLAPQSVDLLELHDWKSIEKIRWLK